MATNFTIDNFTAGAGKGKVTVANPELPPKVKSISAGSDLPAKYRYRSTGFTLNPPEKLAIYRINTDGTPHLSVAGSSLIKFVYNYTKNAQNPEPVQDPMNLNFGKKKGFRLNGLNCGGLTVITITYWSFEGSKGASGEFQLIKKAGFEGNLNFPFAKFIPQNPVLNPSNIDAIQLEIDAKDPSTRCSLTAFEVY